MATSRAAAPAPNLAPFIATAAVILGVGAAFLRLPGALILLIGLAIAGIMSTPPQLTGKKDAAGYPTVGNPGEQRKYDQHRVWNELKWRLVIPNRDWLFNDVSTIRRFKERADQLASAIPGLQRLVHVTTALVYLVWLLLPSAFVTMAGLGLAFSTFTLPVDRLAMLGFFPETATWLMWPNAIAAYILVQQIFAARRRYAAPFDPQPAVDVGLLAFAVKEKGIHFLVVIVVTIAAGGVAASAIAVALLGTGIDWLIYPWQVTSIGAGFAGAALALRAFSLPEALNDWRNLVQARAEWTPRWEMIKVTPEPYIVSHDRYPIMDDIPPVIAETFNAPASLGADGMLALAQKGSLTAALGGGSTVYVINEPDKDSKGQPIEGTRSPLSVTLVSWPTDARLDVNTRGADQDAFALLLRALATTGATDNGTAKQLAFDGIELITAADDEKPGIVWATRWGQPDGSDMNHLGGMVPLVQEQFGVDAVPDPKAGILYIGDVYGDDVQYLDENMPEHLLRMDRDNDWAVRWRDALAMHTQAPHVQHDVYQELTTGTGEKLYVQPFMSNLGLNLIDSFVNKKIEEQLSSTLGYAPFVSIQHYPVPDSRPGSRHSGALQVVWSPQSLPSSPAKLKPVPTRGIDNASRSILQHMIDVGFDAARFPRPEIASVSHLTARASESHIWDIQLRLYGAATLSEVKKKVELIRNAMGAPPWIRITPAEDGCRIIAGATPTSEDVRFAKRQYKDMCTALDWEQAFTDAKITGPNGEGPTLVSVEPMPKNPKVEKLTFKLPPGIDRGAIRAVRGKLKPMTGNIYLEDEAGPTPGTITMVACPEEPVPFPAPFDWEAVAESSAIPFASGVTGDPIEYDWRTDPHMIFLGGTGTGKSSVLQNLITGALIRGCDVYVADPTKAAADFQFAAPWVKAMPVTDLEASAMMDHIYKQEVVPRKKLNAEHGVGSYTDLPEGVRPRHIVVIIDEFTSLMFTDKLGKLPPNASEEEQIAHQEAELANQARRNIGATAGRLVREARSAGVTLILAAQELKSDTIASIPGGGALKNNSSSILLGKSTFGSRQSALKDAISAPELGDGVPRGRGLFESSTSSAQVIQAWYDAPDHLGSMTAQISAVRPALPPEEKVDLASKVKKVEEGPVFGRVIADDHAQASADLPDDVELVDDGTDEEVDYGEIDLGFGDMFSDTGDEPERESEAAGEPDDGADEDLAVRLSDTVRHSDTVSESESDTVSPTDHAEDIDEYESEDYADVPLELPTVDFTSEFDDDVPTPLPAPLPTEEPAPAPAAPVKPTRAAVPPVRRVAPVADVPVPNYDDGDDMFGFNAPRRAISNEEAF